MGRKGGQSSSNALIVRTDNEGKTDYTAIAKRGHGEDRIVHSTFSSLIPLRQQANAGLLDLSKPSAEVVQATKERTAAALNLIIANQNKAQNPKNVAGRSSDEPTFVRYTPTAQMGEAAGKARILKIQQRQIDPMVRDSKESIDELCTNVKSQEPPKFRHKKIPGRAPSPPPPVLHSPPRKLTAADQEMWRIPPPISNWKNPKGQAFPSYQVVTFWLILRRYTIALDKRLASDGRNLQDVTISDKFAAFNEALAAADRHAREEVQQRALMQQRLAEKEKLEKEEHLRNLARQAREERANHSSNRRLNLGYSDSESDPEEEAVRRREDARKERKQEFQRELRQSKMGTERKLQMLAREQNRDISEKVALGLAKPTQSGESMYDSRLFNKSSGFDSGFNEDQAYDKPLFAAQDAISSIYRPSVQQDDGEDENQTYDRITKNSKFEVLGRAKEGFKGADLQQPREGPVQFEKDTDDPFQIDAMIKEVQSKKANEKKHGLREPEERSSKRARVVDYDDSD